MTGGWIHDQEFDTSEAVVRSLLRSQCPQWADGSLDPVATTGTTNALWRLRTAAGDDLVVRMPRTAGAARSIAAECDLLPQISPALKSLVRLPAVRHPGVPEAPLDQPWAVFDWLDGDDGWSARSRIGPDATGLAVEVAALVERVRRLDPPAAEPRPDGDRGGPLGPLLARLDQWLSDPVWSADALVDVGAVRRCAAESAEVAGEEIQPCFLHGDLLPGNILVDPGALHLTAVIDWGAAGIGDPAQDLAPTWAIFEGDARRAFVEAVNADDATWLRARAFELEHAVGGLLYYRPRQHPLADVMERTLDRILVEFAAS